VLGHLTDDPHTNQTGWVCTTPAGNAALTNSNVYAGQSVAGLDYFYETTPAYILVGALLVHV
jgi:hypothetical protein